MRRERTGRELRFKDEHNRYLVGALIYETCGKDSSKCLYTLNVDDLVVDCVLYRSLRKLYLESEDPTEFKFAEEYFFDYEHWLKVSENNTVKQHLDKWRRDLLVKIRSKALQEIIQDSSSGSKTAQQSARFLAQEQWKRLPKEDKVEKELSHRQNRILQDAMKRIGKYEGRAEAPETSSGE